MMLRHLKTSQLLFLMRSSLICRLFGSQIQMMLFEKLRTESQEDVDLLVRELQNSPSARYSYDILLLLHGMDEETLQSNDWLKGLFGTPALASKSLVDSIYTCMMALEVSCRKQIKILAWDSLFK